jgi:hypothetical protein
LKKNKKVIDLNSYPKTIKFVDMNELVKERSKQRRRKVDEALIKINAIIDYIEKY